MAITTGSWQAGYFLDTSDSVGENATGAVTLCGEEHSGSGRSVKALSCVTRGV